MPRLFVIRHGITGRSDIPLTPNGINTVSSKSDQVVGHDKVREWDYGDYEGLKPHEIKEKNPTWNIWTDGCPGGESVEEMTARVDSVIARIREVHRRYVEEGLGKRDTLIFSHGHFSRVLISRWMEFTPALGTHFNFEAGGIALLSYNHGSLKEPSLNGLNLYAY
ncbi:hypothetical protein BS47DRAFT_1372348 [Hydnum rufescens UP504]|uniref:Phosphoglycerate mutase n=1 Tax=Hydnum rufescens UP504 TaxID=1448309 RepID=A0A9P6AZF0_9AGAM|nr:hypothetical protein BS47DRAFT_1372348 [Hydnum rufescens UP504]